ncbi:hypothetical protein BASA83_008451 [Batrachochytrium salamandrivorans]|nr:hypothetical protein BASA83_008451 [Batrachochytrium salamandrivorans]
MVSDDSESMVPLGDHLTSPVKILTRSLIIHGHVSKLEIFHTLLKTLFPPSCMHPDSRSTCSTCSESLLYSIIAVRRKIRLIGVPSSGHHPRHFQAVMNHLCAQRHMRWNIRAARDNSLYPRPRSNPIKPPSNSRRIISWNINGLVSKRNDLREHIAEFIQHPASGPGKRGIALGFLAVLPAREIEGVPGTLIRQGSWSHGAQILQYQSTSSVVSSNHQEGYLQAKNAYRAWLASRDSIESQETIQGGCAKQAWNAAKRMACASGHSCRSNPIRNEEGVLQFQPISICNTLRSHYMRLAEAGEHAPEKGTRDDDGITTALMQAIAHDPKDHGTGDVNLDRPGALALLRVANTIFYLVSSQKCGGVAYYGLELIGGNSTLARRLQAPVNTGIRMILKAPLFTPISPMLTDCGIISLDAHAILARVRLTDINRSISNTQSINTSNTIISTTIPSTPTLPRSDASAPRYAFERTFQVWGKSKLACSYVQANHASSAKFFALAGPQYWPGHRGLSPLTGPFGGLWDYPRALKAGLLHPTATNPDQLGSPSRCYRQSTTRGVQIFDCTLHTTTTTTATTATTTASPSLSTTSINNNPDSTGTSAIWDSMDIHTPSTTTSTLSGPLLSLLQVPLAAPLVFHFFHFYNFHQTTHFEPPISVGSPGEIPRQAQDTVEENPTGSRTTTTDTHTAAISSTPTPTHISHIGSDDILTVLLGGSLPGTNTAGNTEACPGQQWLTGKSMDYNERQILQQKKWLQERNSFDGRSPIQALYDEICAGDFILNVMVGIQNGA